MLRRTFFFLAGAAVARPVVAQSRFNVLVYGSTPAGVAAAIAAARTGARVGLVEPGGHVGGRFSDALGFDEINRMDESSYGGLFSALRAKVDEHYGAPTLLPEPGVHEKLLRAWLEAERVELLDGFGSARLERAGGTLAALGGADGRRLEAQIFIDATYMGDLLGQAGSSWKLGREGAAQYNESLAGVRRVIENPPGELEIPVFHSPVSPFRGEDFLVPMLHGMSDGARPDGSEDPHLQAANLLACMSKNPDNRVPFEKQPRAYSPAEFEILARELARLPELRYGFGAIPNDKGKMNESIARLVHWGYVGGCDGYPQANMTSRRELWERHKGYTERLIWFLQNEPAVPEALRESMREWGLAKDEFTDNDNWPRGLYVREGRRLVGDFVLTQKDLYEDNRKEDSIALGSFPVDSHAVRRLATKEGVINEGGFLVHCPVYELPYRALLPKKSECTNLLAPVGLSASRVAFCSVRVEPTWMALGEAAGAAAALASKAGVGAHEVNVSEVQARLKEGGLPIKAKG
ncbi:MAG: FAD-dependent oxidoreductase [Acidobacteria bacterium]|nr:FAD-dependent oxidoreductase [Acidobacteriota bacterium]